MNLSHNKLTALPKELGSLTTLESLDLGSNLLGALPPELKSLTLLKTLNLRANALLQVPPEVTFLKDLSSLDVSHNKLLSLPSLAPLKRLAFLSVASNPMSTLPDDLGACAALRVLDASACLLTSLPLSLNAAKELAELHVAGNPSLTALPDGLEQLEHLEAIVATSCGLRRVPVGLAGSRSLVRLELAGNKDLEEFPFELLFSPGLATLTLELVPLPGVPEEIAGKGVDEIKGFLRERERSKEGEGGPQDGENALHPEEGKSEGRQFSMDEMSDAESQ